MEGVARLEFMKTDGAATVTNRFSMMLDNNVVLDGIVQWSDRVPRPNGQLGYKCPVGDATGEELARCTVWQGVIYTADEMGNIELLPAEGVEAPKKLIFPDLGYALRMSSAYGANGFSQTPGTCSNRGDASDERLKGKTLARHRRQPRHRRRRLPARRHARLPRRGQLRDQSGRAPTPVVDAIVAGGGEAFAVQGDVGSEEDIARHVRGSRRALRHARRLRQQCRHRRRSVRASTS